MDKIRLGLIALGLIFAAILVYYLVGFVFGILFTLLFYAVVVSAIAAAGLTAYKYLTKPKGARQLTESRADLEYANAQKAIDEYRRRSLSEKN